MLRKRSHTPLCVTLTTPTTTTTTTTTNKKLQKPPSTKKNNKPFRESRKKTTRLKYDPPYAKKPMAKYVSGANANANHHHSQDDISLDGSKMMFGNHSTQFRLPIRDKSIRRLTATSGSEDDPTHSGGAAGSGIGGVGGQQVGGGGASGVAIPGVSDIERTVKSLNGYHEDILEALRRSAAQGPPRSSANTPSGSISEELLRKTIQDCVTAGIPLGPPPSVYPTEREYKRSCSSRTGSKENICEPSQHVLSDTGATSTLLQHHRQQQQIHPQDEDDTPSAGPLRIRNLEDLIRQLEHHSSRHMSPSGSEDIRMSETEVDRHYRVDSSAACSESSHGSNQQLAQSQKTATILPPYSSRCRPPRSDDESRFSYGGGGGGGGGGSGGPGSSGTGRYRHPASRHPAHQSHSPHSPHAFGHHTHHGHTHHSGHAGHSSHHSSHTHLHQDDEGIYESADPVHPGVHPGVVHGHDRNALSDQRDTNDSESDDLFQAQQQLARWASEDVVSVVVMEQGSDSSHAQGPSSASTMHGHIQQHPSHQQQQLHHQQQHDNSSLASAPNTTTTNTSQHVNGVPAMGSCHNINSLSHQLVNSRDYYPSPPSTETESSGSVIQPPSRRGPIMQGQGPDGNHIMESTGRYPEYKH